MHIDDSGHHKNKAWASGYFFIQGLGAFLPYSTIISTLDFYNDKFPNANVSFTFPIAIFAPNILMTFLLPRIRRNCSLTFKVDTCIFLTILLLIAMPFIALKLSNSSFGLFILFALQFFIGIFNTISNASMVSLASRLSSDSLSKSIVGLSVSGFIGNLLRAFCLLFSPYQAEENDMRATLEICSYYILTAIVLIFCVYSNFKFMNSRAGVVCFPQEGIQLTNCPSEGSQSSLYELLTEMDTRVIVQSDNIESSNSEFKNFWRITKTIMLLCVLMIVGQIQNYMFVPGVLLKKHLSFLNPAWKIVLFMSVFNLFDAFGKLSAYIKDMCCGQVMICILVFMRIFFYFTFTQQSAILEYYPIDEDLFGFLNIALFGFIGGYITGGSFVLSRKKVRKLDKEDAGFLAFMSLLIGSSIGTLCALPFRTLTPV